MTGSLRERGGRWRLKRTEKEEDHLYYVRNYCFVDDDWRYEPAREI